MATTDGRVDFGRFAPRRDTLLYGAAIVNVEVLWVLVYLATHDLTVTGVTQYVYPFVWINVGLWALWRTRTGNASRRRRWLAAGVAGGYWLVLAVVAGVIGPGAALTDAPAVAGFRIADLPPGIGPAPIYEGLYVQFAFLPYRVVGYLALARLVYATLVDTATSALGGVVGLFSCVSCTWPIVASLIGGAAGASTLTAAVSTGSYVLSTVVFVATVVVLRWRPLG